MKKKPTIEEIINFNFSKELGVESLSKNEQEDFNQKMFLLLIEKIILRTTENFSVKDLEEFEELNNDKSKNLEEVLKFVASKNKNFFEEAGEEFLNFKKEIYDLLKN